MNYRRIFVKEGQRFNRLTVIKEVDPHIMPGGQRQRKIRCKCDCGKIVDCYLAHLRSTQVSCGCYITELFIANVTTHGMTKHPLRICHTHMLKRCHDSTNYEYHNYGGRGIKVCKEWRGNNGLQNFSDWNDSLPKYRQYKKGLQIDREDNNKGYSPDNCRWVTCQTNNNNRRDNLLFEYEGELWTIREILIKANNPVSYSMMYLRLKKGWSIEAALSTERFTGKMRKR